jgi:hypothetical protein
MNKKEAIELLKQCLQEAQQLKQLDYVVKDSNQREANRQQLTLWVERSRETIKAGAYPEDAKKIISYRSGAAVGFERQEHYIGRLFDYEAGLKKIIHKYEQISNLEWYLQGVAYLFKKFWHELKIS